MPQFDFFSFSSQTFWVSICTVFFYLVFLKFFLKNLSECFKIRQKLFAFRTKQNSNKVFDKKIIYKKIILNLVKTNLYKSNTLILK
jgi:hypothetical protein